MAFSLTVEQEAIQTVAREVMEQRGNTRDCFDGGSSLDRGLWRALVEIGVSGVGLPAHGGLDGGLMDQVLIAEEGGRIAAAIPFLFSTVVSGGVLNGAGHAAADAAARSVASGEEVAATVFDTPSGDLAAGDGEPNGRWRISGEIPFVIGGELADHFLVPVEVEKTLGLFLFPAAAPGASITELATLDPTRRAAAVALDDVSAHRIDGGSDADGMLRRARMRAEVMLAADALGAAASALDRSIEHALEREQFGRPIGQFQAVKHTLADMLVDVENARSATYNAAWAFDEVGEAAALDVAMAKALATESAVAVVHRAVQIHGGMGVTWDNDLHILLRRAKSCALLLGDPGEHFARIASMLLDEPEQAGAAGALL